MNKERIVLSKLNSILKKRKSEFIYENEFNSLFPLSTIEILYSLNERKYIARVYEKNDYQLYMTLRGKEHLNDHKYKVIAFIVPLIMSLIAAVFSVLGYLKQ